MTLNPKVLENQERNLSQVRLMLNVFFLSGPKTFSKGERLK